MPSPGRDPARPEAPLVFFALAFAFIVPFWVLGELTARALLPGLPVAALATACPAAAALVCVHRERGRVGVTALLRRAFDVRRVTSKWWYVPAVLLMPAVMALSFVVLRLIGTPVPPPTIKVLPMLLLTVVFFVAALGEELGWSGYATDPLQQRWGALRAALLLGLVWAVYHFVGLAQAHRSVSWIAWWSIGTVAARVIMVWLYNRMGHSVFAATLFHTMINVTWQLFPVNGSYYDPRVTGLILALVAVIVVVLFGAPSRASAAGRAPAATGSTPAGCGRPPGAGSR